MQCMYIMHFLGYDNAALQEETLPSIICVITGTKVN